LVQSKHFLFLFLDHDRVYIFQQQILTSFKWILNY
jgi:hypothetical protein